jgi:hypothetical protein
LVLHLGRASVADSCAATFALFDDSTALATAAVPRVALVAVSPLHCRTVFLSFLEKERKESKERNKKTRPPTPLPRRHRSAFPACLPFLLTLHFPFQLPFPFPSQTRASPSAEENGRLKNPNFSALFSSRFFSLRLD